MGGIPKKWGVCWWVLGWGLAVGACDSGAFQGEVTACACEGAACGAGACTIALEADETCGGFFEAGEVLVDTHIEEALLSPDVGMVAACGVPLGASATVWVRAGRWKWGPVVKACEVAGARLETRLSCVAGPEGPFVVPGPRPK